MNENLQKAFSLLVFAGLLGIFCFIVLAWVDVAAEQVKADVSLVSAEMDWEYFLQRNSDRSSKTVESKQ